MSMRKIRPVQSVFRRMLQTAAAVLTAAAVGAAGMCVPVRASSEKKPAEKKTAVKKPAAKKTAEKKTTKTAKKG